MEGCFNYVLFAGSEINEQSNGEIKVSKYFLTQSDGSNTAKTPAGVFDELKIPNDLGYIVQKINDCFNTITNVWTMLNELIIVSIFFKCLIIAIN